MNDQERITNLLNAYRGEIMAKSPKSLSVWQANRTVMPAGVGSLFRLADPFPMVVKRAEGARIWDADDNEYLDFMLGFSTMILGNTPHAVQEAIRGALPRGTQYGQCHEHEYEFAELFCDMVPGVEKVTFCNSGSEATQYAVRLARAATGRPLVAKFEGGYHGTHDLLAVSFGRPHPDGVPFGPVEDPAAIPESPGLADGAWKETIVLPFNHPAAFDKILRHAKRLAAVIIEPVQRAAGSIPAKREFLSELRRITHKIGAFLIFDEVVAMGRRAFVGSSMGTARPESIADEMLERFHLREYRDEPVSVLPEGVRKLLDIAMALVVKPQILLLDEPSGVSSDEKFELMDLVLGAIRAEKVTVLFVEHDMEVVRRYTQRIVAFYEGRVIADGPTAEVLSNPEVRRFVVGEETPARPREERC